VIAKDRLELGLGNLGRLEQQGEDVILALFLEGARLINDDGHEPPSLFVVESELAMDPRNYRFQSGPIELPQVLLVIGALFGGQGLVEGLDEHRLLAEEAGVALLPSGLQLQEDRAGGTEIPRSALKHGLRFLCAVEQPFDVASACEFQLLLLSCGE